MALVKLSTKLVGSTVKLNENSSPVEFVVAHQNSPSSAYSGFEGGTVLVRKGAHSSRIWGEDNGERYYNYPDDCEIHTWLNNTYLNTLDSDIQAAVKQVKIPYVSDVDYGGAGSVNQGSNGLSCKVFLLSLAEIGFSATSGYSGVPDEGTVLSWFASSGDDARNLNGNDWWLRTPAPASSGQYAYYCTDGGSYPWMSQGYNAGNTTQSKYVRPALVLDAELYVDDNGNVITNQPPSAPSSIAASNVIGDQNATVTLGAATDEDGTIANYIYERQVDGGSWTQFASTSSLTTTDSINDSWTTVTYRAKAVDNLGAEGPYATSQAYTVVHNQPPTAPGSINATNVVGGQDATITITAATDPDGTVESYMYERSVDDSSHWDVIATTSALSTTDHISSDWGTVTYRAKAVDDDGASGPYVTSEQYDVNVGWVLIGGPSTAMGQQIKPFTLSAAISVSGQTGVTGIAVTGYMDGAKVMDAILDQGENAEISVDTRILASGQHTIQMQAEKADLLPANKAWQFAIPFNDLPDGGRAEQLRDDQGNPIFPRTTSQQVIGKNGVSIQNDIDAIEKSFRGLTGHLEQVDAVYLGSAGAQTELPRESGVHYCFGVYSTAGSTNFTMVLISAGSSAAKTLDGNVTIGASADKFTAMLNGSNAAIVQYFKFVVDSEAEIVTNPVALFTALEQPHVFSASGGSTSSVTSQTEALETIIADNTNHNYYVLTGTDGTKYYIAAQYVIQPGTGSFTGPVYQDDQSTTLYAGRTLTMVDTSNVAGLFTPLNATVYDVTTQGTSVSAGSNINETLLAMIEAQPTWHRYAIPGSGGETYYVLSEAVISPDAMNAPDVYYCTDGSTYYTGGTLLLLAIGNVGDIMTFAGQQWIISHKTASEAYLTLNGLSGNSTWYGLQQKCTNFANSLNEAQKNCLKSVTAGNTSGKVFVATKDQMNGGFSYFNSNSRRSVGSVYWTSTEYSSDRAWFVDSGGRIYGDGGYDYYKSNSLGFRPSICIDLTKL